MSRRTDGLPVKDSFRRGRRRRRIALGASLVVLALVAAVVAVITLRSVPLTDDPTAFGDDLTEVMERIRRENAEVERKHPDAHVTIVALLPMSGEVSEISMSRQTIRHGLQGIYLAQLWRNRLEQAPPYIRVLVGSNGPGDWAATFADLERRAAGERIVAVTGLGASTESTRRSVADLSERYYGMSAAVITSDEFGPFKGLARVAPLNSDQAKAVLRLARHINPKLRATVVKDRNRDDSYSKTLGDHFTRELTDKEVEETLTFDAGAGSPGTVLGLNAERICTSEANTVLYAGRADHLPALMAGLSRHAECADRGITVISGDDVAELARPVKQPMWGDQAIRLFFTALAHSEGVTQTGGPVIADMKKRFDDVTPNAYNVLYPKEPLDDGMAIVHHDAMYLAIRAVEKFAGELPTGRDIASVLTSGTLTVAGASGPFTIGDGGDPVGKNIPVLQLGPDGSATFYQWAQTASASSVPRPGA
ncbi:ABC transporter substrate-binding protein [Nonomuraea endophytica]|uniref:ABC-type branched-subunit amino acid transport system substrate-binding protein n=1 Tax=Nonomuraea endophytica TaxID=714136 RepID=A0A7W7ZWQ3_9ACTN|nr:ABC transporter substrate-binding protein [Nonomuraea endophytica]MBB5075181.1 ABC-type branched-subunit amino acid transport system substrate-binding protein [Nonomuraea endophytica]